MSQGRRAAIDRFYRILSRNMKRSRLRELGLLRSKEFWNPELKEPGVYFLFEPGEKREDHRENRVVRVGRTRTGKLRDRLINHSCDRERSVFAANVFAAKALAARNHRWDEYVYGWWRDIPEPPYQQLRGLEKDTVLPYLARVSASWLPVPNSDERARIEAGATALLSNYPRGRGFSPVDKPSNGWLPSQAPSSQFWKPRGKIVASGLWNAHYVTWDPLDGAERWLAEFEALVDRI